MIQDRIIVCVANSWDYDPTCKHHIMKVLSRHNDIVWINYHGTRRPRADLSDLRSACSTLRRFIQGVRPVGPTFVQLTPLCIPGATNTVLAWLHDRMLITQIRRAVRSLAGSARKSLQIWAFAPDVACLAGQFEEECFVYYCADEFSKFEGVCAERITAAENRMLKRADVVITTSESLLRAKRVHRPDAILARHGVDYDHFASAWRLNLSVPPDIASIPNPIFGFFGLIHHWIDVALIAEVARLRPGYSFVLIGECKVDVSRLRVQPNVHLLGRRPFAELPAYCSTFVAGMLPFVRSDLTVHVNPIKMYEYLAAGLPIISTPMPEALRFRGPVRFADTPQGFAERCDEVLSGDGTRTRAMISRTVEKESWLSKVEWLSDVVLQRLRETGQRPSTSCLKPSLKPRPLLSG